MQVRACFLITSNIDVSSVRFDQITKFYYTFQMMAEEYCPTISAFQTHKVANQKPVPVTVYDYYDQCECEKIYPG